MDNVSIKSIDGSFKLNFGSTKNELNNDYEAYERFIKGCEEAIRGDDRYSSYIGTLKEAGLDYCAIRGDLKDTMVKVEMHHGPIFTLFDICDIALRHLWKNGTEFMTTFELGDIILTEHENDNIQIVMLSKTPHKGVHMGHIFIHTKASFGRVDRFIKKYKDGLEREHLDNIAAYLELCIENSESADNGLLEVSKRLKNFK